MPLTLENRGYYLELGELPDSPEVISSYFFSSHGNLRPHKDAVVVRGILPLSEVRIIRAQFEDWVGPRSYVTDSPTANRVTHLIEDINASIGAASDRVQHTYMDGQGSTAHIDTDYVSGANKLPASRSKGMAASLGVTGRSNLGFSSIQRHWKAYEDDVFNEQGEFPRVEDMRTVIAQGEGDLVFIRPGVVHAVRSCPDRQALLFGQDNLI